LAAKTDFLGESKVSETSELFFLPLLCALNCQHTGLIVRFAAKDDCIADSELNIVRHRT